MRVAVLDLGSNSFRLLVADVDNDGSILPVLREREMLHLGAVVAVDGRIAGAELDRAASAGGHLAQLAERTGADRRIVVATAAIREAANHDEVVGRLAEASGEPIRVLSGREEASLAFLGVAASVSVPPGAVLVLDLGGGSLELAIGRGATPQWCASVELGVSRLWAEVGKAEPLSSANIDYIAKKVRSTLQPLESQISDQNPTSVVSVGGSNRSLAQLIAPERLQWQPETLNQFEVSRDELDRIANVLRDTPRRARMKMPGMKPSRADQLPTASVIVSTVLEMLGVERTLFSYWGLREGVILDTFGITDIPTGPALRPAAIARMESRFSPHRVHDAHVAVLARQIFDQLQPIHRLGGADAELLEYGARLHTIGMGVAFRSYHRHGAYLVEHAEFRGFDPAEIAILASLVRFHRRGFCRPDYPPYAGLDSRDRLRVDRLVAQLHLADALDRSLDQSIETVRIRPATDTLEIELSGPQVALRRDWATRAGEAFQQAFDVDLRFPDSTIVEMG